MKRICKAAAAALVLAVGLAGSVAAGPYEDGTAAAKRGDYDTAVRLIRPLADQGDSSAKTFLGQLFRNGMAAAERRDYDTAVRLIRPLANQGDSSAKTFLGQLFRNGTVAGRRGDYDTAMRIMRPLAEQGDSPAQTFLAHLFRVVIPPDYAAAASWFSKAAEQGDAFAQDQLGFQYANGLGVTQDHAAAASWRAWERS